MSILAKKMKTPRKKTT